MPGWNLSRCCVRIYRIQQNIKSWVWNFGTIKTELIKRNFIAIPKIRSFEKRRILGMKFHSGKTRSLSNEIPYPRFIFLRFGCDARIGWDIICTSRCSKDLARGHQGVLVTAYPQPCNWEFSQFGSGAWKWVLSHFAGAGLISDKMLYTWFVMNAKRNSNRSRSTCCKTAFGFRRVIFNPCARSYGYGCRESISQKSPRQGCTTQNLRVGMHQNHKFPIKPIKQIDNIWKSTLWHAGKNTIY